MNQAPQPSKKETLEITLNHTFDAPRDLVFAAWSEGEHLKEWSCPRGMKMISGANDPRVGGKWHIHMQSPDGMNHVAQGVYREITKPERLVLTHAWEQGSPDKLSLETRVTVTLAEAEGGKTHLTFHQTGFPSIESQEGHRGGWSQTFDNLADYLAR